MTMMAIHASTFATIARTSQRRREIREAAAEDSESIDGAFVAASAEIDMSAAIGGFLEIEIIGGGR